MTRYLIDGNNVMGSRPDGWWRDRSRAIQRLTDLLAHWSRAESALGPESSSEALVTVVYDGDPVDLPDDLGDQLDVVFAGRRRSADDEIARRAAADPEPASLTVVTSDAGLAGRVSPTGAAVVGSGAFRRRLGG